MSQHPQSLDYASPSRRRSPWRWLVVVIALALVMSAGWLLMARPRTVTLTVSGVSTVPGVVTPPPLSPVVLTAEPMTLTLVQRRSVQLPGGPRTPTIHLGDITRGQVIVQVTDANYATLLSQSMKQGDTASFTTAGQTLFLRVGDLANRLTGDDQATLEISATQPLSEADKIDALIAHVERLDGATFIRNGTPHSPMEAADHLRKKRDAAGDKIKTAIDFIDGVATESYLSGKPYQIKLKDGTEHPSGDYLKQQLKEIEKAGKK